MASSVTLKGNPIALEGNFPVQGSNLQNANFTKEDLSTIKLSELKGSKVVLNIFPSIDTGVCASSVRKFNEIASDKENVKVLCVSKDLPFALSRFCGSEGIKNVDAVSDYKNNEFANAIGTLIKEGPLEGLHTRAVVVLDEQGVVSHSELVKEITTEPNYEDVLKFI